MSDSGNKEMVLERIGASAIGVADYRCMPEARERLDEWLKCGCEGELGYMREHKREDAQIILPECESLIVVLFSPQKWTYHSGIRKRLKRLLALLKEYDESIEGRGVVDTAPLLERAWGVEAHLGWVGRNSMLIHPELGSNFNIGVLLVNKSVAELKELNSGLLFEQLTCGSYDSKVEDGCKDCLGLCLKHCPGSAIRENRTIFSPKCLSYLSQRKEPRPEVLGCTVCQRVCPYNNQIKTE